MNLEDKPFYTAEMRLDISHLKLGVIHHLRCEQERIDKAIEEAAQKAFDEYDFEGEVKHIALGVLRGAIENYFKYGNGHDEIYEAITAALAPTEQKISEAVYSAAGLNRPRKNESSPI